MSIFQYCLYEDKLNCPNAIMTKYGIEECTISKCPYDKDEDKDEDKDDTIKR